MSNCNQRVFFPKGEQGDFIISAKQSMNITHKVLAGKLGVSMRTLSDWKREKFSMPLASAKKLSRISSVCLSDKIEIKNRFWYVHKGGKAGGIAVYKKYGRIPADEKKREKKWREWWDSKGKFNNKTIGVRKEINIPSVSKDLAEFTGIIIGDGGITKKQVTVTLHKTDDKEYSIFVAGLFKGLFNVKPGIHTRKTKDAIDLVISRVELVEFCSSIGLKIGNKIKQGVDIPKWIKCDTKLKKACVRGLMDTDGCIFNECHKIKEKRYCYPRMSFVSASPPLRNSFFEILKELGFSPKHRNNRSVNLEKREDIVQYFKVIGTNNNKHRKRFKKFIKTVF